nr:MAG TPA: hypothetical protein [Caudoviricetes sp.]
MIVDHIPGVGELRSELPIVTSLSFLLWYRPI